MWAPADRPQSPALQLVKEAEAQLLQLMGQLKTPHLAALPSAVAVVAIRAAGTVAQQRPQLLGRIMPTLVGLASADVVSSFCRQPLQLPSSHALRVPEN